MTARAHPNAFDQLLTRLGAQYGVPLASFSTLKVGGPARFFVMPKTVNDIAELTLAAAEYGVPWHILSGGSNTLFSDRGYDGVIIKLGTQFDYIHASEDGLRMTVGMATPFAKVTKMALARGWSHALGWCGTPGLMGGAIRMNAGTRMGEIKDAVGSISGVLRGTQLVYHNHEVEFSYRGTKLPSDFIIYEAELAYSADLLEAAATLMPKVQEYKFKRKATQPTINSLGSFFKNPYPSFAAQLIENCNLKGLQYRSAQISPKHANFIVNNGGATANDILYIASFAQTTVFENYGVVLHPEVRLVGNFDSNPLCVERFRPVDHNSLEQAP